MSTLLLSLTHSFSENIRCIFWDEQIIYKLNKFDFVCLFIGGRRLPTQFSRRHSRGSAPHAENN